MTNLLVNIDVDNIERAILFYQQAFGLTVGRWLAKDAVELLGLDCPLYLLQKDPATQPCPNTDARRIYSRHWTPVHLDIIVSDIESAITAAVKAGAQVETRNDAPWGRIATLADPFGHGFCLLQFIGGGYDVISNEQFCYETSHGECQYSQEKDCSEDK